MPSSLPARFVKCCVCLLETSKFVSIMSEILSKIRKWQTCCSVLATYLSCGAEGWGWRWATGDMRRATGELGLRPHGGGMDGRLATTTSDIRWGWACGLLRGMDGRWATAMGAGPAASRGWMGDERLAMDGAGPGRPSRGDGWATWRHATSDMRHAIGASLRPSRGMMDGRRATGDMRWGQACGLRGVDGRHATGDIRWGLGLRAFAGWWGTGDMRLTMCD